MASSSSKRRKGKEPMEQRLFDEKKFRTFHHALQFGWMADKEIICELGFQVKKTECPEITEKVEKRRWELLTDPVTARINATLVREFYANAAIPAPFLGLCDKAGVVFEDKNPEWIKVGIPITVRRMHAVASPLPQRRIRKRVAHQAVEGQNPEEQAAATLNMHQL
ncbi:hypothetical protein Ahy_B05g077549 [Arachis hypogaea]|uniref:Uncharacterized protein n=1 Tax=Arachis hypogaea TaxID=3818 RepID=A0A444Z513_ARAHY|nr:hypothetical protein Ahy_B05g077549 [Arachis hypogaea]